jgi:hypothetical protein
MSLNGEGSFLASIAEEQNLEVYEATETGTILGPDIGMLRKTSIHSPRLYLLGLGRTTVDEDFVSSIATIYIILIN